MEIKMKRIPHKQPGWKPRKPSKSGYKSREAAIHAMYPEGSPSKLRRLARRAKANESRNATQ